MTETAAFADVLLPASGSAEVSGSFTGADGKTREFAPAVKKPAVRRDNLSQIIALCAVAGYRPDYKGIEDVRRAMRQSK